MDEAENLAIGVNENVTVSKKVFDDMDSAHKATIAKLEQQNKMLEKQVNDYSIILQNINASKPEPKKTSEELVQILLKGVR